MRSKYPVFLAQEEPSKNGERACLFFGETGGGGNTCTSHVPHLVYISAPTAPYAPYINFRGKFVRRSDCCVLCRIPTICIIVNDYIFWIFSPPSSRPNIYDLDDLVDCVCIQGLGLQHNEVLMIVSPLFLITKSIDRQCRHIKIDLHLCAQCMH